MEQDKAYDLLAQVHKEGTAKLDNLKKEQTAKLLEGCEQFEAGGVVEETENKENESKYPELSIVSNMSEPEQELELKKREKRETETKREEIYQLIKDYSKVTTKQLISKSTDCNHCNGTGKMYGFLACDCEKCDGTGINTGGKPKNFKDTRKRNIDKTTAEEEEQRFKGVYKNKKSQKYFTQFKYKGNIHYSGGFESKIEAATVYNDKCLQLGRELQNPDLVYTLASPAHSCGRSYKVVYSLRMLVPDHQNYQNGYTCDNCSRHQSHITPPWPVYHCSTCSADYCGDCGVPEINDKKRKREEDIDNDTVYHSPSTERQDNDEECDELITNFTKKAIKRKGNNTTKTE